MFTSRQIDWAIFCQDLQSHYKLCGLWTLNVIDWLAWKKMPAPRRSACCPETRCTADSDIIKSPWSFVSYIFIRLCCRIVDSPRFSLESFRCKKTRHIFSVIVWPEHGSVATRRNLMILMMSMTNGFVHDIIRGRLTRYTNENWKALTSAMISIIGPKTFY